MVTIKGLQESKSTPDVSPYRGSKRDLRKNSMVSRIRLAFILSPHLRVTNKLEKIQRNKKNKDLI